MIKRGKSCKGEKLSSQSVYVSVYSSGFHLLFCEQEPELKFTLLVMTININEAIRAPIPAMLVTSFGAAVLTLRGWGSWLRGYRDLLAQLLCSSELVHLYMLSVLWNKWTVGSCGKGSPDGWSVCDSADSWRLWGRRWRSDCLRRSWSCLLSATVLPLSGTPTLTPVLTTVSSTTTLRVITAHTATSIAEL